MSIADSDLILRSMFWERYWKGFRQTATSTEGQFGSFLHGSSPDRLPWQWSTSWEFGASWGSATHFNHLTSCKPKFYLFFKVNTALKEDFRTWKVRDKERRVRTEFRIPLDSFNDCSGRFLISGLHVLTARVPKLCSGPRRASHIERAGC